MLTADYIAKAKMDANRFSGAWTGTSGNLAAHVRRLIDHIRELEEQMETTDCCDGGRCHPQAEHVGGMTPDQLERAWSGVKARQAAVISEIAAPRREYVAAGEKVVDGDKTRFGTGAVRSSDAEGTRYDLISPIGLEAVARTCAEGAAKYSAHNWERGMDVPDLLNHALRHIYQFLSGDRSEPHLPHAAWGLLAAIHSDTLWPQLNADKLRGPGCKPPPEPPL